MKKKIVLIATALLLVGCVTNTDKYYWGEYQELLYQMSVKPGVADPVLQIDKLTTDILQAEESGLPVPPGVYAHLGMMYAANGDIGQARESFNQEKALYPESSVLIDGMLERSKNNNEEGTEK